MDKPFQWDEITQARLNLAQRAEELAMILRSIAKVAEEQERSWRREKGIWHKLGGKR